jgi:anti-sigma-K factor RskA
MNASPHDDGQPDIEALFPWYLTGRLSAADRRRVELYLERNPERHAALAVASEEAAANVAANEALPGPDSENLNRLLNRLPADTRASVASPTPLIERVLLWLSDLSPQQLGVAAAAIITVVAVQAVTIGTLIGTRPGVYETATGSKKHPAATSVELLIGFKPEATMADATAFLKENNLAIVDGPNAGMFRVAARGQAESTAALVDRLKTSPLVAIVLPGR